eukprot:1152738-Rhodomonas_salina.1
MVDPFVSSTAGQHWGVGRTLARCCTWGESALLVVRNTGKPPCAAWYIIIAHKEARRRRCETALTRNLCDASLCFPIGRYRTGTQVPSTEKERAQAHMFSTS